MSNQPWLDRTLSAKARADALIAAMTLDEKIGVVNGHIGFPVGEMKPPEGALGSAGYIAGIERLGVPAIHETDASLGVANLRGGDGATALPSGLALAASWNEALAEETGAMIGAEARAKGFNVMLAGGANLTREPRCGRNFEYLGEDPLLAGVLAGASIRGIQSNRIVSTMKHFALNAQETGRMTMSAEIDEAALRESDLLAFQIALERGDPGSVMSAYNRVNGTYCGEHGFLLNDVLKRDWGFEGWVMSDWGGCHSTEEAALGGLDQQSGQEFDRAPYFNDALKQAVEAGKVPAARLDDMARRVLLQLIKHGALDDIPARGSAIDQAKHLAVARKAAAQGTVLLKNDGALPLSADVKRIAVIGGHADIGVLSGGGSSQVVPWGGPALRERPQQADGQFAAFLTRIYHPGAPVDAICARATKADVRFDDGSDPTRAAALAKECDVAIVFAEQWTTEFLDLPNLTLPDAQDALIAAVADANAKTIVVLENGTTMLMPWLSKVSAVLTAWYPGLAGGEAIADTLFGVTNPSGRLPITFAARESDLPNPVLPGSDGAKKFDAHYPEGADTGYRWFAREKRAPLFPFGFGLSYTTFAYANLSVEGGETLRVSFDVTNTGKRAGAEVAQVYLTQTGGKDLLRLIGWSRLDLAPGETKRASIVADRRLLAHYDVAGPGWRIAAGKARVAVSASAQDHKLTGDAEVTAALLNP